MLKEMKEKKNKKVQKEERRRKGRWKRKEKNRGRFLEEKNKDRITRNHDQNHPEEGIRQKGDFFNHDQYCYDDYCLEDRSDFFSFFFFSQQRQKAKNTATINI